MTSPATLMLAKILIPETDKPATMGGVKIEVEKPGVNIIDAASRGASDGLHLALNIGAMLIAFIGLIAMLNGGIHALHDTRYFGWLPDTMQGILGRIFATVGNLLGTRLILNEFVAFVDLGKISGMLDPKSFVIATYALCGFANLSSVAIQVGGIGALAPSRKSDLARLGMKAVAAGTMANFMSACIAGMLL
jgi:CNT family concentrative nucleoside transporter